MKIHFGALHLSPASFEIAHIYSPILVEKLAARTGWLDILGPGTYLQNAVGIDKHPAENSAVGKDVLGPDLNLQNPFHSGQGTENNTPEEAEAHILEKFLEIPAFVHGIGY